MNPSTPIQNIDQKIDVIDHVNQDHTEELLAIVQSQFANENGLIVSAKILDLYQEGMKVSITRNLGIVTEDVFIPFEIEGSLEENILYLAYAAIVKQGRDFSGTGKRFFEVINNQKITTNMVRLTVQSATALPEYYPGYAYAFLLKKMTKRSSEDTINRQAKHWTKAFFDRIFIWLMKHLSSKNRQKLLDKTNKDIRLYTLRKSWKSIDSSGELNRGYIDIFTHGDTPGSQWAQGLTAGDIILSRSESKDNHPHLASGQALLVADETAYPALAGILEHWQNPLPPYIVLLCVSEDELEYFASTVFPEGSFIHKVVCAAEHQAAEVLSLIEKMDGIESAWGAFESESAKKVRHYLRNHKKIIGKNNHVKAYWNAKSSRGSI